MFTNPRGFTQVKKTRKFDTSSPKNKLWDASTQREESRPAQQNEETERMKRTDDEGRTHRDKHLVSSIKKFIFKFYSYFSNPSIHLSYCPFAVRLTSLARPTHLFPPAAAVSCDCPAEDGGRGGGVLSFLNPESHRSGPSIIFQQASHVLVSVCLYILCVCVRLSWSGCDGPPQTAHSPGPSLSCPSSGSDPAHCRWRPASPRPTCCWHHSSLLPRSSW